MRPRQQRPRLALALLLLQLGFTCSSGNDDASVVEAVVGRLTDQQTDSGRLLAALQSGTSGRAPLFFVGPGAQYTLNATDVTLPPWDDEGAIITGSGRLDWQRWAGWQGKLTLHGLELRLPPALPGSNLSEWGGVCRWQLGDAACSMSMMVTNKSVHPMPHHPQNVASSANNCRCCNTIVSPHVWLDVMPCMSGIKNAYHAPHALRRHM
jgi:hypothetical protein